MELIYNYSMAVWILQGLVSSIQHTHYITHIHVIVMYIHTYVHTYIHTCIHTYIHTYYIVFVENVLSSLLLGVGLSDNIIGQVKFVSCISVVCVAGMFRSEGGARGGPRRSGPTPAGARQQGPGQCPVLRSCPIILCPQQHLDCSRGRVHVQWCSGRGQQKCGGVGEASC